LLDVWFGLTVMTSVESSTKFCKESKFLERGYKQVTQQSR